MDIKGKILIVDDEQINLDFFDVMLSKLGFEVYKAQDGEEALDQALEYQPDIIILDNIMPKLSGWEVTKLIKSHDDYKEISHIPIIMFSAMDDVKDKIEGFELGIEDYITKPFNFSEVLARIKAVLRNKELSKQVVQRERQIALIETLNKSLLYFTQHLRQPVLKLHETAKNIDPNDTESVKTFVAAVTEEFDSTLAALDGLEEEIEDLKAQGDKIKRDEISLEDLDEKYQKHFDNWKEKEKSAGGVQ